MIGLQDFSLYVFVSVQWAEGPIYTIVVVKWLYRTLKVLPVVGGGQIILVKNL